MRELPRIAIPTDDTGKARTTHEFVFTSSGLRAVSGFSKAKERVQAKMLERYRKELTDAGSDATRAIIPPFTLHDLRRTAASGMASIGIAPHVVDRILNHVSGTIRGVAAVYNRHAYAAERAAALDAWSRHVAAIAASQISAPSPLPRAAIV